MPCFQRWTEDGRVKMINEKIRLFSRRFFNVLGFLTKSFRLGVNFFECMIIRVRDDSQHFRHQLRDYVNVKLKGGVSHVKQSSADSMGDTSEAFLEQNLAKLQARMGKSADASLF